MSEQQAQYDVPLAPGTRVRERESSRLGTVRAGMSDHLLTLVQWDDEMEPAWEPRAELIPLGVLARAPERALCPGIVVSADTCGGKPRLAGTGISTRSLYAFWNGARIDWPEIRRSYDVTAEQHHLAIAFEAGLFWERKRRRTRKARQRARRWERGKAASEGVRDAPQ